MKYEFEVGDTIQHAEVTGEMKTVFGAQICVMSLGEQTDKEHLKKEMEQCGFELMKPGFMNGEAVFSSE